MPTELATFTQDLQEAVAMKTVRRWDDFHFWRVLMIIYCDPALSKNLCYAGREGRIHPICLVSLLYSVYCLVLEILAFRKLSAESCHFIGCCAVRLLNSFMKKPFLNHK